MRKAVFRTFCGALVLACIGLITLWVRSYWVADTFSHKAARAPVATWVIESNRGRVTVSHRDLSASAGAAYGSPQWTYVAERAYVASTSRGWNDPGADVNVEFAGFSVYVFRGRTHVGTKRPANANVGALTFRMIVDPRWKVALPYWFPVVLLAVVALGATMMAVRRARRGRQLCRVCGYDLRATPEPGGASLDRCPECGAVPPKPPHNPPMQRTATASRGAVG